MFKNYIESTKEDIINSTCRLINFPSISSETNNKSIPFGKSCNDALNYFLELSNELGFRTKNIDGYCGYAEFGEGKELIGIIGHLDVVPANKNDWTYEPFNACIDNNKIYGRGAIDDKGPVIASLFAMKSVMDFCNKNNIKLNKRVRLIVGLNEEKDWKCINYYKLHEEIPTLGFSPDSDFPCIYAEKSVLSLKLSDTLQNHKKIKIEELDCNNNAINVVPKYCSVTLSLFSPDYINEIQNIIKEFDYNIELLKLSDTKIKLISHGISAHSAHPDLGVNAISHLIIVLTNILKYFEYNINLFNNFCKFIGDDYSGTNMNLNIEDESGKLTLTTSQLSIKDDKIFIGINLRIPVHTKIQVVINKFSYYFTNTEISILNKIDALYIDKNSKLVSDLCNIFNTLYGSNFSPISIGGATYARAFPNCISFGMNFPGDTDMCHQVDEYVEIDKLILATNIYANAIYKFLI